MVATSCTRYLYRFNRQRCGTAGSGCNTCLPRSSRRCRSVCPERPLLCWHWTTSDLTTSSLYAALDEGLFRLRRGHSSLLLWRRSYRVTKKLFQSRENAHRLSVVALHRDHLSLSCLSCLDRNWKQFSPTSSLSVILSFPGRLLT